MEIIITIKMDENDLVNLETEEIEETKKKPDVEVSPYAKFFDDACVGWSRDPEANLMFLKAQENYANDLLEARGHLFLNDVYNMLGMPNTKTGQVVGWVYNVENPIGDNHVDFGIYDEHNSNFVNGYENTILLDFNVDGNILEYLD